MLLASKVAAALLLPLDLSILLGFAALVLARRHRPRLAASCGLLALSVLVVSSLPPVADALVAAPPSPGLAEWIPSPEALSKTHRALREHLGLAFYRITGRA